MTHLEPTVDPAEVGFDPDRLTRIDDVLHGYVDSGKLPMTQFALARHGQLVHHDAYGWADVEERRPLEPDALFRIYSMTKPITAVALLMLYEQGKVLLEDPLETYLPEFADPQVYVSGNEFTLRTRPATRSIRVSELLSHTSGLSYGINHATIVDELYRRAGLGVFGGWPTYTNAEMVKLVAGLPLQHDPGTRWLYSMGTDVAGALVEVLADQPLDEFFQEHIFAPLGMVDTGFWVPPGRIDRLTTLYARFPGATETTVLDHRDTSRLAQPQPFHSGGGGLVSTMSDYLRFAECLRGGGVYDGHRLLSPRTVRFMASNHLPGGVTLNADEYNGFSQASHDGMGFGLGVMVSLSPQENKALGSPGDFTWGGSASTTWLSDPVEDLTVLLLTQLAPSYRYPLRSQIRALVYQALVD